MNPIEELLQQMSLREPSADLDQRIERTLRAESPRRQARPMALWSHLLTAAVCLLAGIVIGRFAFRTLVAPAARQSNSELALKHQKHPAEKKVSSGKTKLGRESLVLFNGRPARTFDTVTQTTMQLPDEQTGQPRSVHLPVRRVVITESFGI